jgi:hypothetical protein
MIGKEQVILFVLDVESPYLVFIIYWTNEVTVTNDYKFTGR